MVMKILKKWVEKYENKQMHQLTSKAGVYTFQNHIPSPPPRGMILMNGGGAVEN